jgi:hypothetical protein
MIAEPALTRQNVGRDLPQPVGPIVATPGEQLNSRVPEMDLHTAPSVFLERFGRRRVNPACLDAPIRHTPQRPQPVPALGPFSIGPLENRLASR